MNEEREKSTTFVCVLFGGVCLFVSFFIVAGMRMAVKAMSFLLPLQIFKPLWVSKTLSLKFQFIFSLLN